eukprot:15433241-Alexandrium_andersonii.AAC.1
MGHQPRDKTTRGVQRICEQLQTAQHCFKQLCAASSRGATAAPDHPKMSLKPGAGGTFFGVPGG